MRKILTLACLLALTGTATALADVRIYSSAHHGSFPVAPEKLKYDPAEIGGQQSYVLKDLAWMDWTTSHPTATGTLKSCVEGGDCFTVDATAKAGRLVSAGGDGYYTKLRLIFGQNKVTLRLPTPAGRS
jgi:hypothetical protein